MKSKVILILIFILAIVLRLFGLNWDQNQHLHPDERFLTMVASDVNLPKNISEYFNTAKSPLNPENKNYSFYVYGTVPLLITRSIAELLGKTNYDSIFIVGRILSAFFDSLIIFLLFGIGKILKLKSKTVIASLVFYALAILPVQLSHFFTVDTFVVFFSTLTVYLFLKYYDSQKYLFLIASGFSLGITLANKISIGITLPLFLLFILFLKIKLLKKTKIIKILKEVLLSELTFLFFAIIAFRIFQPYAFNGLINISPLFIKSITIANQMITGEYDYPPNIQWHGTIPILHPLINIFLFGLGPILTLLSIFGVYKIIFTKRNKALIFIICFTAVILFYQGIQLAKYMRYFYPIYPFLVLFASHGFNYFAKFPKVKTLLIFLIFLNTLVFVEIYSKPHSRVTSSNWICQNIPRNSVISSEHWDDSLPLNINYFCDPSAYDIVSLKLYDPDLPDKWITLNQQLDNLDYLVMSSNRLWGSIPKYPDRYPVASLFYKNLFDNKLNFKKMKTIYSYPGFPLQTLKGCLLIGPSNYPSSNNSLIEFDKTCDLPGIYFRDDIAEESFTVYDHPKILIYQKNK
jgi:4-amino-4-deoxy-L-arabinose transferase-like glycosyltransferase